MKIYVGLSVKTKEYDIFYEKHVHFIISTKAQIYMPVSAILQNWLLFLFKWKLRKRERTVWTATGKL